MPACSVKGRGADCVGFISGVLEELYRRKFPITRKSPVGYSHESDTFLAFALQALIVWPIEKSETVDVGDLILERPANGHAHLYICGSRPFERWHCLHEVGVCTTGFCNLNENYTFYRLKDKEKWS